MSRRLIAKKSFALSREQVLELVYMKSSDTDLLKRLNDKTLSDENRKAINLELARRGLLVGDFQI